MPASAGYDDLRTTEFASYRLRVDGLVEAPLAFSLAELQAMPKQTQLTTHFRIQGWTGVAERGRADAAYPRTCKATRETRTAKTKIAAAPAMAFFAPP